MFQTRLSMYVALLACATSQWGCGARTDLFVPELEDTGIETLAVDEAPLEIQCIEIREGITNVEVPLRTEAQIRKADVFFLLDITASMGEEIRSIRSSLSGSIAPAIQETIPDGQIGLGVFGDFPILDYGAPTDFPFELRVRMTQSILEVQGALENTELGDGADLPESQVEALYLTATGEGFGSFVQPSFGCPLGGSGHPCFRDDALPVIMLITDAAMHNGPDNIFPYAPTAIRPRPHNYADAVEALQEIEARVMGFSSGDGDGTDSLRRLAQDTRTTNREGEPLVFEIGRRGNRLSDSVVGAIRELSGLLSFDVSAAFSDAESGTGDEPKGSDFVVELRPVRADPPTGIDGIEEGIFRNVLSGTELLYELVLDPSSAVPGSEPQSFLLRVDFFGDERVNLGSQLVEIVIPSEDGRGCQ